MTRGWLVVWLALMASNCFGLEIRLVGHWTQDASTVILERGTFWPKRMTDIVEVTLVLGNDWLEGYPAGIYRMDLLDVRARTYGNPDGWIEYEWRRGRVPEHSTFGYDIQLYAWAGRFLSHGTSGLLTEKVYRNDGTLIRTSYGRGPSFKAGVRDYVHSGDYSLFNVPSMVPPDTGSFLLPSGYAKLDSMSIIHDGLLDGDSDADGEFNQLDLVQVLSAGKYLTGQRAAWSQGDWTADGLFDQRDIVAAVGNYGQQAQAMVRAVPEPASIVLAAFGLCVLLAPYLSTRRLSQHFWQPADPRCEVLYFRAVQVGSCTLLFAAVTLR